MEVKIYQTKEGKQPFNELRFFFGKGYRVYYAKESNVIVLLLCGGDKSTQQKDLNQAKVYWQDYQERNK
jgi:putative addiction module killer protein